MIGEYVKYFCCEDISLIENYEKAISDDSQIWDCHHKNEITLNKSVKELKSLGLYYNRPANELIFLTHSSHMSLHNSGNRNPFYDNHSQSGENHPNYGKHPSTETRKRQSEKAKNRERGKWMYKDNIEKQILEKDIKEYSVNGWQFGRTKHKRRTKIEMMNK